MRSEKPFDGIFPKPVSRLDLIEAIKPASGEGYRRLSPLARVLL
jgi:hypothetical protein